MSNGTDNLERTIRTRPLRSEFDGEGQAQRIARDAVRRNRQTDRRAAAKARRDAEAEAVAE